MIYFISDLHFNHENIIKYCNRPFANAEHMNAELIANWNSVVQDEDDVYVLGDFVCGLAETIPEIISQLKGHIHLILGNHDTKHKIEFYEKLNIPIKDIEYLQYKGLFLILNHFPLTDPDFFKMVANGNSEVVDVHGHVHDASSFVDIENNKFNVSADAINFAPVSIETIYRIIRSKYIEKGVWKGN